MMYHAFFNEIPCPTFGFLFAFVFICLLIFSPLKLIDLHWSMIKKNNCKRIFKIKRIFLPGEAMKAYIYLCLSNYQGKYVI